MQNILIALYISKLEYLLYKRPATINFHVTRASCQLIFLIKLKNCLMCQGISIFLVFKFTSPVHTDHRIFSTRVLAVISKPQGGCGAAAVCFSHIKLVQSSMPVIIRKRAHYVNL
jgi:hypothetical protein